MSEDTPWLSDAQLYGWMHLTSVFMTLPTAIEQQLKRDSGLNLYEYSVLAGLSESPGHAMKMSSLASTALGSPSRLSHAITRLERAGWVQRRNCSQGSRAVEAVLTEAGYAKVAEAAPAHVREARRLVVDVLSTEELCQLRAMLSKILQATDPQALELLEDAYERRLSASPSATAAPPLANACTEEATEQAPAQEAPTSRLEACKENVRERFTRTRPT